MGVVDQATDLKMIPSAVQSPCLKKWTCWLVAGLADDSFTRLFSDNFLHMFLFFIYKHRYKSKEIKKNEKNVYQKWANEWLDPFGSKKTISYHLRTGQHWEISLTCYQRATVEFIRKS